MPLIDRIGIERGRMSPVVAAPHYARWRDGTGGGKMSDRHVIGNPGEEPEAAPPRTAVVCPSALPRAGRCRLPLHSRPSRGISVSSASMLLQSWWSRPPEVETWGSAPTVSRQR